MIIGAEWMTSSLITQTNLRKQALEVQAAERSIIWQANAHIDHKTTPGSSRQYEYRLSVSRWP
jgi:hypothetical protein